MKIIALTHIAFQLNGALGSGRYDDISIADVKKRIRDGTILEFLVSRMGEDLDIGLISPLQRLELVMQWSVFAECIHESRKMCVDRGGLCLLVAYLLEGIQCVRRTWIERCQRAGFPLDGDFDDLEAPTERQPR